MYTVAQISDSHLFADSSGLHHDANVYQNLVAVLSKLATISPLDAIVFTGDLTQDHSEASFQLFANAVVASKLKCAFYWLAGNHDEPTLMQKYLSAEPFCVDKSFNLGKWQILLIDSKSDNPSGYVSKAELSRLSTPDAVACYQLALMHHHPIDVGYFIDRHGLTNQESFWQAARANASLIAIGCSHVHRAMTLSAKRFDCDLNVYTTPATSIEFDICAEQLRATSQGPGYRLYHLTDDGELMTSCYYIK